MTDIDEKIRIIEKKFIISPVKKPVVIEAFRPEAERPEFFDRHAEIARHAADQGKKGELDDITSESRPESRENLEEMSAITQQLDEQNKAMGIIYKAEGKEGDLYQRGSDDDNKLYQQHQLHGQMKKKTQGMEYESSAPGSHEYHH